MASNGDSPGEITLTDKSLMLIRKGYTLKQGAIYFQMSARHLQRKLKEEGTRWADLRNIVKGEDAQAATKNGKGDVGELGGSGKTPESQERPSIITVQASRELTEELVEEKILFLLETADDARILDSAIGKAISFLEKKNKLSAGDEDTMGFTPDEIRRLSESYALPEDVGV